MISDYEIVEYINPLFPDKQMYKCTVDTNEFHTDDYGKLVDWVYAAIVILGTQEKYEKIKDKSITSFFEGTLTSKD